MKTMSLEDAEKGLGHQPLEKELRSYWKAHELVVSGYIIPGTTFVKTVLAGRLGDLFCRESEVWILLDDWVDGPYANFDLFYGYRRAHGEMRTLMEAPAHMFLPNEAHEFISIVSMVLYFGWDARIFGKELSYLVEISNDETIEFAVESSSLQQEVAFQLSKLGMSRLEQAK